MPLSLAALTALLAGFAVLAGCGASSIDPASLPKHPPGKAMKAGAGFLTKAVPSDEKIAVDASGKPAHPKVTKDFINVPRSNGWWSSLIWQNDSTQSAVVWYMGGRGGATMESYGILSAAPT